VDPRTQWWNTLIVWPLEGGLRFLAADLHLGAALAVVLFTLLVRLVLYPLSARQARTQSAMKALQPELAVLRQRYGADAARLQRETAALYRRHGVHPLGGMLPTLVQLPLLFGLYAALRDLSAHDATFLAPWLWLKDLHQPDVLAVGGVTFPGPLPVLAAGAQWAQQRLLGPATAEGGAPGRHLTALISPLLLLWFGLTVPAGLCVYWVTQSVAGGAQQAWARRARSAQAGAPPAPPAPTRRPRGRGRPGSRNGGRAP
jgi:YidC/Oxa1 family membrane protein insertase